MSNPLYGAAADYCYEYPGDCYWQNGVPVDSNPYPAPQSSPRIPQILATQQGITSNNNKLDSVLSSILSGLALIKGARGVPTTLSNEPVYIPVQAPLGNNSYGGGGGGNTAGQLQAFIQKNTGAVLIGTVLVVALFMKPPTKK